MSSFKTEMRLASYVASISGCVIYLTLYRTGEDPTGTPSDGTPSDGTQSDGTLAPGGQDAVLELLFLLFPLCVSHFLVE